MPQKQPYRCPAPGCTKQVGQASFACLAHWETLPETLRRALWRSYRSQQERGVGPSEEHLVAMRAATRWLRERAA